ncbi:MAG: minor capsid protein [Gammaproteobacteria bacterium]
MATQIRHTKKQTEQYHAGIKKITLEPLQSALTKRLAQSIETAEFWQTAIDQSFNDPEYLDSVDEKSDPLSTNYINNLSAWQEKKMKTQFQQLFGMDVIPLLKNQETQGDLNTIITNNISLIKSIPSDLHEQVNEEYSKILFTDGFDQQKILKMLTQKFSVSNSRAKLIAVDQTGKTIGALASIRQAQVGVKKFIWRTVEDEAVRPAHAALDGEVFFWSAPPDIGIPGQPIRCRCVAEPFIEGISLEAA